jgi:hypothetical protein
LWPGSSDTAPTRRIPSFVERRLSEGRPHYAAARSREYERREETIAPERVDDPNAPALAGEVATARKDPKG